jgi:hypothetical protein
MKKYFLSIVIFCLSGPMASSIQLPAMNAKKQIGRSLLHKTSFDSLQTRYLSPVDILSMLENRFPGFYQPATMVTDDLKQFWALLGENNVQSGVTQQSQPSAALIVKLENILSSYFYMESEFIVSKHQQMASQYDSRFKDRRSADMKKIIPCYGTDCNSTKTNWTEVTLGQLPPTQQKIFVQELLLLVWNDLGIYEEINPGETAEMLVTYLISQYKHYYLQQVYAKIQIWAALRDELLLY